MLDDPPVAEPRPASPTSSVSGERSTLAPWRFAARLARREVRRRPGRTALVALLIAAPVLLMTAGSILVRTGSSDWAQQFERRYGAADVAVDAGVVSVSVESGPVELPAGTATTEFLWTYSTASKVEPVDSAGGGIWGAFTDLDLTDPVAGNRIEVTDGRAPGDGEILLDRRTAELLGVEIGDTVDLERPSGSWTLTGIGRFRDRHSDGLFVVPDLDPSRVAADWRQTVTLYDLPDGATAIQALELAGAVGGFTADVDPLFELDSSSAALGWGWVGGVLALVAVGIIVSAAFATSARRQLVTVGQLAANGATEADVRRVLLLQGTWSAAVGAIAGVAAGVAAVPFSRTFVEYVLDRDTAAIAIAPLDLVAIALTALVAGTLSAVVPARTAARIPVMAALAGRVPTDAPPRRLVPIGLGLFGGGLAFSAIGALGGRNATYGQNTTVWLLLVVLGAVGVVFGMCCLTPLLVETVGRTGRRASLSWRMALRSLGRSRSRSAAVVAAIAVAVGGAVAAAALIGADVESRFAARPLVPSDAVVVDYTVDQLPVDDSGLLDLGPTTPFADVDRWEADLSEILPGATFAPLRVATYDPAPLDPAQGWPMGMRLPIADEAWLDVVGVSVADRAAIERDGALVLRSPSIAIDGEADAGRFDYEYRSVDSTIVVPAAVGAERSAFEYGDWLTGAPVLSEAHARELGFDIVTVGLIARAPDALTAVDRSAVQDLSRAAQPLFDAFIEPGDAPRASLDGSVNEYLQVLVDQPEVRAADERALWITRAVTVGGALVVTLFVVSVGLALAASEGRAERRALAVVGARPASLRRQSAATAAVLALVGILVGIPTGLAPTWVVYRVANGADGAAPFPIPWMVITAIAVVLPVTVAAAAWLGSAVGTRLHPSTATSRD